MFELLIVFALLICVVVVAMVPWPSLLMTGVVTTGAGLVFGLTTGLWYHIALGRALSAASALTPRWWWRPVPLHERLDAAALRSVMPWFYAGAVGFVVTVVGTVLIGFSVAVAMWRSP